MPLNFEDKYNFAKTTKERLAHYAEKLNSLGVLFQFYSIPEKIMQELLAAVNYEPSVADFFSELKPSLQKCIIDGMDYFFPQQKKGYALLYECVLRGLLDYLQRMQSSFREK